MGIVRAAAIYARISSDQDGTSLGVNRQLKDCRALAKRLGWGVGEEYVDNDFSAFVGNPRPAYERMLDDLAEGRRDAVVAYHSDRLTRRPMELEHFVEVLERAGVDEVQFVASGAVDLRGGSGLLMLRIAGAMAAEESRRIGERVRRKLVEVAESGRPHGGPTRPFGYDDDKITVRPAEAEIIRSLVERFLAGESLRSLATWLNDEGIPTVAGGEWRTPTLRRMLWSPRIAGLREYKGEVIGPAVWDPIISSAKRDRVLAMMETKKRSGRRSVRRYLLSGLLRCGKCQNTLFASARTGSRRYVCLSGPDHGGCGRLTVVAEPLEELVANAVLARLNSPELADALAGRVKDDEQVAELSEAAARDREQLDELSDLYANRLISAVEWTRARKTVEQRLRGHERELARLTRPATLAGLMGEGSDLADKWAVLNLDRQHAIVAAILDHVVIGPGNPGAQRLDRDRVTPVWRV